MLAPRRARFAPASLVFCCAVAIAPAALAAPETRLVFAPVGGALGDQFGVSVSVAGDFNGDGIADLVIGASRSDLGGTDRGAVFVYYGGPRGATELDGPPDLVLLGEADGDLFGTSVASGFDLDGDGYDDLAVGATLHAASSGRLYVYFGGPGADSVADLVVTGSAGSLLGRSRAAAGDLNGDGYDDLAVGAHLASGGGEVRVFFGGPGVDAVADLVLTTTVTSSFGYSVAGVGDVDGDGFDDLLVGAPSVFSLRRAFLFRGGATMDAVADLTLVPGFASGEFGGMVAAAGDLNADGFADFVVGSPGSNAASVYFGGATLDAVIDLSLFGDLGSGRFGFAASAAGDVDGDGYDDLLVGDPFFDNEGLGSSGVDIGRVYLFRGGPAMDDVADRRFSGSSAGAGLGFSLARGGDFDFDGDAEIVMGAWQANVGPGRAYVHDLAPALLLAARSDGAGIRPRDAVAADFDGDGVLDLAIVTDANGLRLRRGRSVGGRGDGRFEAAQVVAFAGGQAVATGDFDGDGRLDLLASGSSGVGFFQGDGGGNFAAGWSVALAAARGFAVTDFDQDGWLDFAVCQANPENTVRVYYGAGDGSFVSGPVSSVAANPQRALAHDFNGDGRPDLAVAAISAGMVSIFLGEDDRSFGTRVDHPAGGLPFELTAGDFDHDGITDLAFGSSQGLAVLRGTGSGGVGDGGFAPVVLFGNKWVRRPLAVDVDGDGRTDVVATVALTNEVVVFLGNGSGGQGDGTFTQTRIVSAPNFPDAIVAGDFLQDGRVDFVVTSQFADVFTLFTSDCPGGAASVEVIEPDGGEAYEFGETVTIRWHADPSVRAVVVELSRDAGSTWEVLAPAVFANTLAWQASGPATTAARVRVRDLTVPGRVDTSEGTFSVTSASTGVGEHGRNASTRIALTGPNPVRGVAEFALTLARSSDRIVVDVFDARGRRAARVFEGRLDAGTHPLRWNGAATPPGVYFVRARGEDFEQVLRIVHVRGSGR